MTFPNYPVSGLVTEVLRLEETRDRLLGPPIGLERTGTGSGQTRLSLNLPGGNLSVLTVLCSVRCAFVRP